MDSIIALEIVTVIAAWTVVGYAIWKWGPGLRKRSVTCPTRKRTARVLADQREAEFGCLRVADVEECSLIPGRQLECGKECLTRL
ncbi:MAG: hypothetical protein ACE145_02665 [Terriglobia bacterium]